GPRPASEGGRGATLELESRVRTVMTPGSPSPKSAVDATAAWSQQSLEHRRQTAQCIGQSSTREHGLGTNVAVEDSPSVEFQPGVVLHVCDRLKTARDPGVANQMVGNLHRRGEQPMSRSVVRI